jgi:[ribosomal protein S5]-alanine N-acetyltransferase
MNSSRLQLRKFTSNDFDFYFQLVGDYRVMKMITGHAVTIKKAKEKFKDILRVNAVDPHFGYFFISDLTSSEFIGLGKLVITAGNEAEIGYVVLPDLWGKGYGSEISTNLIERAKKIDTIKKLMAIIDPKNKASKKILEKSGFVLKSVCEFKGLPAEIYSLTF